MNTLSAKKTITKSIAVTFFLSLSLSSCGGGGGSSNSGTLIEGTLKESGGTDHTKSITTVASNTSSARDVENSDSTNSLNLKHGDGQKIEDVQICALGQCSTTDGEGQWGFETPEIFRGGEVAFTIKGHGIDTTSNINIPNSKEIFIELDHVVGGKVVASNITGKGTPESSTNDDRSSINDDSSSVSDDRSSGNDDNSSSNDDRSSGNESESRS